MAKTLKTFDLGGFSSAMPNFSDVTPKLTAPPNINPQTYGSGNGSFGSTLSGVSKLLGLANVSNPLGWASLGANVLGNLLNHKSAKDAQKLQLQMFKEQLKFNHDEAQLAFDREANYNSEVSQVARMRAAGLNPALMFKGADSVNSSAASAPSAPDLKYPLLDSQLGTHGINALLGGTDLLSRNESNLAMINQLKQLTEKYGRDSEYGRLMNNLFEMTFDNQVMDKQLHNVAVYEQIENYKQQRVLMAAQAELADMETQNFIRKLDIEESKVLATIQSAILNSSALKYSADRNLEGTKYTADKHQETEMAKVQTTTFNDYLIAAERNGIERTKAKALAGYLDQERKRSKMETFLAPVRLLLQFKDSQREDIKTAFDVASSFAAPARTVVKGFR